jgi:hypothetical protein
MTTIAFKGATVISIIDNKTIAIHKTAMLAALSTLRAPLLHVLLAYWCHRALDHYPTTRDIAEDTGYTLYTVSQAYNTLIARQLVDPPICPQCKRTVPPAKFHRHHITPGKQQYINICISCHNKAKPR